MSPRKPVEPPADPPRVWRRWGWVLGALLAAAAIAAGCGSWLLTNADARWVPRALAEREHRTICERSAAARSEIVVRVDRVEHEARAERARLDATIAAIRERQGTADERSRWTLRLLRGMAQRQGVAGAEQVPAGLVDDEGGVQ